MTRKTFHRDNKVITVRQFAQLAQLVAPRALETMKRLMSSAESEQVQLQAAAHILDRAYGKPVQPTQEMLPDWTEAYSEADMALAIEAIERRIARHKAQVVVDVPASTESQPVLICEPLQAHSSTGQADEGPVAHEEGGPPGG